MGSYATKEQFRAVAHQPKVGAEFDALYGSLLERASRIFDLACEVDSGFFDIAGEAATERVVYGSGDDFLSVPPFIAGSITGIELPEGYDELTADDYYEVSSPQGARYLIRQYGTTRLPLTDWSTWAGILPVWPLGNLSLVRNNFRSGAVRGGWPAGEMITITARWGWAAIPAEVTQATLEVAIKLWRESDPASLKTSALEAQAVAKALPDTAEFIAERYRANKALAFA
jgi:hypothetical protein